MRLIRSALAVVSLVGALVATPPAAAKENVTATLKTSIPLDAAPGTRLRVRWRLEYVGAGSRRPFGAGGVYVRLGSASGGGAETAFADGVGGDFAATVLVPEGGIGDVQIGLVGIQTGENGSRRADMFFPIANDPLPGPARVSSTSSPSIGWILGFALVSLAAAAVVARRRFTPKPALDASP